MRLTTLAACALASLTALALALTGCLGSDDEPASEASSKGEIVITCSVCNDKPPENDTFAQYRKQLMDAFNAKYKGRYRVEAKPYTPANDADRAQHYVRAAATDTLPDLWSEGPPVINDVARSGKLMDFAPALEDDAEWKASFQPDVFTSVTDEDGHIWAIPEQRDAVGIYYNKALFKRAGLETFPTTWDEFFAACARLKSAGVIPFAMDGDWVTQLMWANLIGTQPGGPEFLLKGIKDGDFAANSTVVQATEMLKRLHTEGYVNKDAFTGDYNRAAAPFLDGQAAMIANGPWMIPDIEAAQEAKGSKIKDAEFGYVHAPGDGLLVLAGTAGWASGAKDDADREAVIAFMKFMTSPEQEFRKALDTGSYWPTTFDLSDEQIDQLEPLSYSLFAEAERVAATYPHAKFATPQAFTTAWVNGWPAYVQGKTDAQDFLDSLSEAVTRQR